MESARKVDRLGRILALLERISEGTHLTANGLAEEFDVSRRTVFRDLSLLRDAGVNFRLDGPEAGYKLKVLRECFGNVTQSELLELLIHARHSVLVGTRDQQRRLDRTIRNAASGLTEEQQQELAWFEAVDKKSDDTGVRDHVGLLVEAIARGCCVNLMLSVRAAHSRREVKVVPVRVEYSAGVWRLFAVDQLSHQTMAVDLKAVEAIAIYSGVGHSLLAKHLLEWEKPAIEITERIKRNGEA